MININFKGIKNNLGSINLININFDKKKNIKKNSINKSETKFDFSKNHLISNYSNFCNLHDFEIPNATIDKLLVRKFIRIFCFGLDLFSKLLLEQEQTLQVIRSQQTENGIQINNSTSNFNLCFLQKCN